MRPSIGNMRLLPKPLAKCVDDPDEPLDDELAADAEADARKDRAKPIRGRGE